MSYNSYPGLVSEVKRLQLHTYKTLKCMILQHWHAVTEFQKEMNPFKKAWIIMICNNQSALMRVLPVNQYMHDMRRNAVTNKRCLYTLQSSMLVRIRDQISFSHKLCMFNEIAFIVLIHFSSICSLQQMVCYLHENLNLVVQML